MATAGREIGRIGREKADKIRREARSGVFVFVINQPTTELTQPGPGIRDPGCEVYLKPNFAMEKPGTPNHKFILHYNQSPIQLHFAIFFSRTVNKLNVPCL